MTLISALIIVACFAVGGFYQFFSDKIDAPAEQAAENVLLTEENISVDFSAAKKKKLADAQAKEQTQTKESDAKKD